MQELVTYKEVIALFMISRRTLARWKANEGFPEVKLSYNVSRYNMQDIAKWAEERQKNLSGFCQPKF